MPSRIQKDIRKNLRGVGGFIGVEVENCRSCWIIVTTIDNGPTFRLNMNLTLDWEFLDKTAFAPDDRPVEVFRDGVDVTAPLTGTFRAW